MIYDHVTEIIPYYWNTWDVLLNSGYPIRFEELESQLTNTVLITDQQV
jgi:hypothetical protein